MNLEECRSGINRINREMLRLFTERMELAGEIAAYKKEKGLPILDPTREREILAEVAENVPEELSAYARSFFSSLMEISRAYQSRLNAPKESDWRELLGSASKTPSEFPENERSNCQEGEGMVSKRISLTLTLSNTPGSLSAVLSKLAIGGCNLLRIESCPIEGRDLEVQIRLAFEAPSAEVAELVLDDLEYSVVGISDLGSFAEL